MTSEPSARTPRRRHDPRHELLLRGALAGELERHHPALRSVLDSCRECRAQYEALLEVRDLLDSAGRVGLSAADLSASGLSASAPSASEPAAFVPAGLESAEGSDLAESLLSGSLLSGPDAIDPAELERHEVLNDVDWRRPVAGRELVGPFVRDQLAREGLEHASRLEAALPARATPVPIHRPWWQSPWVAAAAAGILLIGWAARGSLANETELPRSATLGAHARNAAAGMSPSGSVEGFGPFECTNLEVPAGGRVRLTVFELGAEGQQLADLLLAEPKHIFSPDETRPWPDRIRWEVEVQDSFGTAIGPALHATAQR